MRQRILLALLCCTALVGLNGCGGTSCTKDTECATGQKCSSGVCVANTGTCSPACSGSKPVCDSVSKTCKVCTATSGCSGDMFCDTSVAAGQCVECTTDNQCSGDTPVCDPDTRACIVCTAEDGCSDGQTCDTSYTGGQCVTSGCSPACGGALAICDTTQSPPACVACTATQGCPTGTACDLTVVATGLCTGCTVSSQCPSTMPVCDTTLTPPACAVCTASTGGACSATQTCDTTVPGGRCSGSSTCTSDTQCQGTPATPVCDPVAGACVVCTASEGCGGLTCTAGACTGCASSSVCPPATPTCDTSGAVGTCVICLVSTDCPSGQTCDTSVPGGRCTGSALCTTDAQCAAPTPYCDTTGACAACTAAEGCSGATPVCASGACRACQASAECPTATPVCNSNTGACVVCTSAEGCSGATPVCDPQSGHCRACQADTECSGTTPICDTTSGKCVTCTTAEGCAAPLHCDTTSQKCVGCTASGQCSGGTPVCDTASETCVTCDSSAGCTTPQKCDTTVKGGKCVTCSAAVACTGSLKCDAAASAGTGQCVVCDANVACTSPLKCDTAATGGPACVTCSANVPCTGGQTCNTTPPGGQCVSGTSCQGDNDCTSSTVGKVCDTSKHVCVVCTASEGCSGTPATPKCDTTATNGACVQCLGNGDCSGSTPVCLNHSCIANTTCTSDSDCTSSPIGHVCDTAAGNCVVCTSGATGEGCSGTTPKCDSSSSPGKCVQCLAAGDCSDPTPLCTAGTCVGTADPSAQIAAIRAADTSNQPDGGVNTVSLPVTGALVTYLKPAMPTTSPTEPAGFFIQGAVGGPGIFVAIDPTTNTPATAVGDRVSFTATTVDVIYGLKQIIAITGYTRVSAGESVTPMVQDVSSKTDLVTAVDTYESTLVKISGTLGAFAGNGAGHVSAPVATTGLPSEPNLMLRMPAAEQTSLDLTQGCVVTLNQGPMWRYTTKGTSPVTQAAPSTYNQADVSIQSCLAPTVVSAVATNTTTVQVNFTRQIDAATITASSAPTQFTFTGGLTTASASASGDVVTLTTSAQTGTSYTLTVDPSVKDLRGTGVGTPNTATFTGAGGTCSPSVVISQVYGGGNNSGATYQNDFIELHNRGTTTVDISTWSVQYASAAGTSWSSNLIKLTGSIPAGGYYLIKGSGGTTNGIALPTEDLAATGINLSGSAGKVALVNSQTALTACTPTDPSVVDFVGYGTGSSGASCYEGTTAAPTLSNTTAAIRAGNGCADSNNNSADFTASPPNPHNSASTAVPCGCQ